MSSRSSKKRKRTTSPASIDYAAAKRSKEKAYQKRGIKPELDCEANPIRGDENDGAEQDDGRARLEDGEQEREGEDVEECDSGDRASKSTRSDQMKTCLEILAKWPDANGLVTEAARELVKCRMQDALCRDVTHMKDCSAWLQSQACLRGKDEVALARITDTLQSCESSIVIELLLGMFRSSETLKKVCDELQRSVGSNHSRSADGNLAENCQPPHDREVATETTQIQTSLPSVPGHAEKGQTRFDGHRYRASRTPERIEMARMHFHTPQSLYLYHAKLKTAVNVKLASFDAARSDQHLSDVWLQLTAEARSAWEDLLVRLHDKGQKKPIGPAGQQLLEQQGVVDLVSAAIAGSTRRPANVNPAPPGSSEASSSRCEQAEAEDLTAVSSEQDPAGLDCVWSFNPARHEALGSEARTAAARFHFPTCYHLYAHHVRVDSTTSNMIDWNNRDEIQRFLSSIWNASRSHHFAWRRQLGQLHVNGQKHPRTKHTEKLFARLEVARHIRQMRADDRVQRAGPDSTTRLMKQPLLANSDESPSSRSQDTQHPRDLAPPPNSESSASLAVFVEFVPWFEKPGCCYVLLPINTPLIPISNATQEEVEASCRNALEGDATLLGAKPLGSRVWHACLQPNYDLSMRPKPRLVGRPICLRGFRFFADFLPWYPSTSFAADVSQHLELDASEVLRQLANGLSARGQLPPTLVDQRTGDRRRLLAHFSAPPGLLCFFASIHVERSSSTYVVHFRHLGTRESCLICRKPHNREVCFQGTIVSLSESG